MVKRYANLALIYAVIAMIFGVFYREFTKFNDFSGQTNLSIIHTHYFLLGMFFFLILMLIEKVFSFSEKGIGKVLTAYQLGLNITGCGFLFRGNRIKQRDGCINFRHIWNWTYFNGCLHCVIVIENQKKCGLKIQIKNN